MSPFYTLPTGTFLPTIHSSILHSFIHSFPHTFLHSDIPSFVYLFIQLFFHSFLPSFLFSIFLSYLLTDVPINLPKHFLPSFLPYPSLLLYLYTYARMFVFNQVRTNAHLLVGRRSCYNDLGFCMLQSMEPFQLQSTAPQLDQMINEVANFLLTACARLISTYC